MPRRVRVEMVIDVPESSNISAEGDGTLEGEYDYTFPEIPSVSDIRQYVIDAVEFWGKGDHPGSWTFDMSDKVRSCRVTLVHKKEKKH